MASAQILPNSSISSKKQQQLEAGKRRLEEFRRKKAAAKQVESSNSVHSADGLQEKKPSVSGSVQVTENASDVGAGSIVEENEKKAADVVREAKPVSISVMHTSPSISGYNTYIADPGQTNSADGKLRDHGAPYGSVRDHHAPQEEQNAKFELNAVYGIDIEQSRPFHTPEEDTNSKSNHFNNVRLEYALSSNSDEQLMDLTIASPVRDDSVTNPSPERSGGASLTSNSGHSDQLSNGPTYEVSSSEVPAMGDRKDSSSANHLAGESSPSLWLHESRSKSFKANAVPILNQASMAPAVAGKRTRPSFLDSITLSSRSSASLPLSETEKANPFSSKIHPVDAPISSDSQNSTNTSVANGGDLFRHGNELDMEMKNNYYSAKQNDDFAALEQHIEDLTQEKFSLQRALEASRVLAESLATENSALTDSYNQQGGVVHQLKYDMERIREEIKAQLAELEALRIEYGNAQLECSAADERAKLLASEVIGLEEKALRLRSNELKLERQSENLQDEISSYKKRLSSLEKEHQDLQFTIDALQEEKKLMQSKLRKAPPSGKSVDIRKSPTRRNDASTSTRDLVIEDEDTTLATSNLEMPAFLSRTDATSSSLHPQNWHFGLEVSSLSISPDQMRRIENINSLISELALEKEELAHALSAETTQSSKLKDLNNELSHKLEVQTQRLELLTSQSMASDNIPAKKSDPRTVVDSTSYADEGDEVVERVLGWIMKLFPGGPSSSRRQTKHL